MKKHISIYAVLLSMLASFVVPIAYAVESEDITPATAETSTRVDSKANTGVGDASFDPIARSESLIDDLDREADRIDENDSWEAVDGLSEQAVDAVDSAMSVRLPESVPPDEIQGYVDTRFALIDAFEKHAFILPEGNRKDLFENALERMKAYMTMD